MAGVVAPCRIGPVALPATQGYFGTGGPQFTPRPRIFLVPAPPIGVSVPAQGIGEQWAPGQGGDTPGGGGAALIGASTAVETRWFRDGFVVPPSSNPVPGSVGAQGYRRARG